MMMTDHKATNTEEASFVPLPKDDEIKLAAQLDALRQQRAEVCWQEIMAVLQRHNCELAAVITPSPNGRSAVAHPVVNVR